MQLPVDYDGKYYVNEINAAKTDSINHIIELRVQSVPFFNQTEIKYVYTDQINSSGDTLIETTGVIDSCDKEIFLHPPRKAYMRFSEIPPFPQISLPPALRTKKETELSIVTGYGELNGKVIKQVLIVTAKEDININKKKYSDCWVLEGENINYIDKLGNYKVRYWFNTKFGFVKMLYTKPDGSTVSLELVK